MFSFLSNLQPKVMNECGTQLLDLNDDCLLLILKYIPFHELLLLYGKICQRLDALIDIRLKQFTNYAIMMREPPHQFNDMHLQKIGNNLRELYISVGYSIPSYQAIKIVQPIFIGAAQTRRLRILSFHYIYWTQEYLDILEIIIPQIVQLDISYSEVCNTSKLHEILDKGISLRRLIIRGVNRISVSCLNESLLARLEYLEVDTIVRALNKLNMTEISQMYPNIHIVLHDNITGKVINFQSSSL